MGNNINVNRQAVPQAGQIYRHFKGDLYQVVAIAEHTENGEALVIYQALYGTYKVYARPLEMFMSKVDREKYPDVAQEYRFALLPMEVNMVQIANTGQSESGTPDGDTDSDVGQQLDDDIWEFLDAESYEQRLRIFTGMQHRLNDDMINIMAVSMDTEVPEGELSERITSLKSFLMTQVKFECSR